MVKIVVKYMCIYLICASLNCRMHVCKENKNFLITEDNV